MAQLIQMRQRIKAIETIKKVTHAMRLISMSTHSRMKGKERSLNIYTSEIKNLFHQIKKKTPEWTHPLVEPTNLSYKKILLIIVGSQKGLCGTFNTALFKMLDMQVTSLPANTNIEYICVGKQAIEFIKQQNSNALKITFPDFSVKQALPIAGRLTNHIITGQYSQVFVISNILKTFFVQKPTVSAIVPLPLPHAIEGMPALEYYWEQEPSDILDILVNQYVEAIIHDLLFKSLLAEQAARFISMDNSTRNAERLLDITKLQYNKLRQTKITRELSELVGSF